MTYEKLTKFVKFQRAMQEAEFDVVCITSSPKGFGKSSFIIQNGQKARILQLLKDYDRVPTDMLKGQYNARINELNKDLAVQPRSMQIISEYDSETQQHYKRLVYVH